MIGGQSTSVGIVLYDTEKTIENAVFCYFDEGKAVYETGEKNSLITKMMSLDEKNKYKKDDPVYKFMLYEFIVLVLFIAAVWIFIGGFFPVFGAIIFSVLGFVPILSVVCSRRKNYPNDEDYHQFRRFHGAEHMVVSYLSDDKKVLDFSEMKKRSIYHQECGTVYSGEAVFGLAILGIAFALIPEIGFLRFILTVLITAVLLFINLFNPLNPFKFIQHSLVEKPKEEELTLAFLGASILKKMN